MPTGMSSQRFLFPKRSEGWLLRRSIMLVIIAIVWIGLLVLDSHEFADPTLSWFRVAVSAFYLVIAVVQFRAYKIRRSARLATTDLDANSVPNADQHTGTIL
jgi:hypothetical protein